MTHETRDDLDTRLLDLFTGAVSLDVDAPPGTAARIVTRARRRRQRRVTVRAVTAVVAASAAGTVVAATSGSHRDGAVTPETQDPGYCPVYGYWQDEAHGVGRLYTMYPTPAGTERTGTPPPDPSASTSSSPSVEPSSVPSDTRTPLPTDRPTPPPPAGCAKPGVGGWIYRPPSPAPWDQATTTPTP